MADENAKELCEREERAFKAKENLNSLNQELALNFYPERADFTAERSLGAEFAVDLYDSEPLRCRRDLGDARASMLRPAGREWAKAGLGDPDIDERPNVAKALEHINKVGRSMMYRQDSGFVACEKIADHDLVTFGNSVKTAESEIDRYGRRILLTKAWHLRDCAWYDDITGVRQDVMFRRFRASARHIRKKFPDATLHAEILRALDKGKGGNPDKEFPLCHVMMPADEYDYYKKPKGRKGAPWVSVYYDSAHKMLLRERPSQRFRYVVDRWGRLDGIQYGFSPASMTALPDGRGIQTMAMVLLDAAEKKLDPPLKATEGAVRGEVNNYAQGITWVDKNYDEKMGPAIESLLPPNLDPGIGIDVIMRTTQALRDTWYLTKLTLPQQAKTAYETAQLVEEFIRANIPLFEPWEAGTAMMLDEIFGVLIDMNAFGPMDGWPQEMSGAALEFTFSNPLQDAIERNKVNQAQVVLGVLAGAAQVNPQAPGARRIDIDEIVEDATRGIQAPAEWIKPDEQVAAEAQQQAMETNIVKAMQGAGAAADIANSGLDAAAKLRDLNQPAADGSAVYGPT